MGEKAETEQFVQYLTEHQNRMYGYIYSLMGDHARSADVLQETNLVLWRRIEDFQPDSPFLPWAFGIARFQVLACIRDMNRDRILLDGDLIETMAQVIEEQASQFDGMREALRMCLQTLTPASRDVLQKKYFQGKSIAEIAAALGRSAGAIKVALLRTRRQLAECVDRRTAREGF